MKKIIFMTILAVLALTGCKTDDPVQIPLSQKLCAEWRGSELSVDAGIYVCFMTDGTFELYQKMSSEEFELRRGTWTLTGDILSGQYNDGEPWSASYMVSVENDKLTMVSQGENAETNLYVKTAIPEAIKESSSVVVKSAGMF